MRTAKKGQVSWFVAIGMVIMIILLLLAYIGFSMNFLQKESKLQVTADQLMDNLRSYVESCGQTVLEDALVKIGNQGGKITPQEYFSIGKNKIEDNRIFFIIKK